MARAGVPRVAFGLMIGAGALFSAYHASVDARYAYLRVGRPDVALAQRPNDAVALGKYLDGRLAQAPETPVSAAEAQQARAGLAYAPLSRSSLRSIGFEAAARGDTRTAERAMLLSNAISRRDAPTQLWLIERAVEKNDVPEAVTHYHRVLAVHPELADALIPILAGAVSEPEVRSAVAPYLKHVAPWSLQFLTSAIEKGDPTNVALMLLPIARDVRLKTYEAVHASLFGKLADRGEFAMAFKLAEAIWPDIAAGARTIALTSASADRRLGILAWTLADDGPIFATGNDAGGFDVTLNPMSSGRIAYRAVSTSGEEFYLFEHGVTASDPGSLRDLKWQAFCLPAATKTLIWEQAFSAEANSFRSVIKVPKNCRGLLLELGSRGSDGESVSTVTIEKLSFLPQKR